MTASACADETPVFAATAARRSAFVIWYFLAFSESEFRDHQSERIRRRIASISRDTPRERRARRATRGDRRKTPIFPSRICNSSDFFAHPHGEARDTHWPSVSSVKRIIKKYESFRCFARVVRSGSRAQQSSSYFISSFSDTHQNFDVARRAGPFATRGDRTRTPRQKYFLLHAKIHREIAEQSTNASPRATII